MIRKITTGHVTQDFDADGTCIGQNFIAGDTVEYEDENGKVVKPTPHNLYHSFEMRHPQDHEGLGQTFDDLMIDVAQSGSLTKDYILKRATELVNAARKSIENNT